LQWFNDDYLLGWGLRLTPNVKKTQSEHVLIPHLSQDKSSHINNRFRQWVPGATVDQKSQNVFSPSCGVICLRLLISVFECESQIDIFQLQVAMRHKLLMNEYNI
jgi:hypothetical protein